MIMDPVLNSTITTRVAVWQPDYDRICLNLTETDFFRCPTLLFQKAAILLKCMNLGMESIELVGVDVMHSLYLDEIFEKVDILPYPLIVDDFSYFETFFISKPSGYSIYKYYSGLQLEHSSGSENFTFLLKPFRIGAWISMTITVTICYLVAEIFRKCNIKSAGFVWFLRDMVVVLSLCCYAANLKAMINVFHKKTEFQNTEELSRLITKGEKSLVALSLDTYHYRLIRGEILIDDIYPDSFKKLNDSLKINPPLVIPNLFELCKKLTTDNSLVYMSEVDLGEYCSQYCFRSIVAQEIPTGFQSYILPKNSTWARSMDTCVDLVINYSDSEIKRRQRFINDCNKHYKIEPTFINFSHLIGPFVILGTGALFSFILLILELFTNRSLYVQYFTVNG